MSKETIEVTFQEQWRGHAPQAVAKLTPARAAELAALQVCRVSETGAALLLKAGFALPAEEAKSPPRKKKAPKQAKAADLAKREAALQITRPTPKAAD